MDINPTQPDYVWSVLKGCHFCHIHTLSEIILTGAECHRCAQLCVRLTTGQWLSLCVYSQPHMLVGSDCTSVRCCCTAVHYGTSVPG